RESEFAVVRSYSVLIGFTRQSARHATSTSTCPRRSRCAPKLSTNCRGTGQNERSRVMIPVSNMNIDDIVRRALDEDLPDITSETIFEPGERGRAGFLVKEAGVI